MRFIARLRPLPALIVAGISLFVALAGTSVAAVTLIGPYAVGSPQVVNGSPQGVHLSASARSDVVTRPVARRVTLAAPAGITIRQHGVVFRTLQCEATTKYFVARGKARGWRLFVGIQPFSGLRRYLIEYGDNDVVVKLKPPAGPWFDSELEPPTDQPRLDIAGSVSFAGTPKGSKLSVGAPFLYDGRFPRPKIITVTGSAVCDYVS